MKKYYYSTGGVKHGPFTLEELKKQPITPDTLIWYEGLPDWRPAKEIPELQSMFSQTPPPPPSTPQHSAAQPAMQPSSGMHRGNTSYNLNKPPKSWLLEAILVTLFCCLPFGIAGIVNASKVESRFYAGDIEGAIRASEEAAKWTKIGFWVGLVVIIFYVLIIIMAGAAQ